MEKMSAFEILMMPGQTHLVLDTKVTKHHQIRDIKAIYKKQTGAKDTMDQIKFYYQSELLSPKDTLQGVGIEDEKHLIEVQTDNSFCVNLFTQQKKMILNEKVTKCCKVQDLKVIYKKQSGVTVKIEDIQFYYKKKLLAPNSCLEEVGIENDDHLISVRHQFAALQHRIKEFTAQFLVFIQF
eukprot:528044_1